MEGFGARRYLQPLLYIGLAVGVHAMIFVIPVRTVPGSAGETARGVRVRAVREGPPSTPAARPSPVSVPPPREAAPPVSPTAVSELPYSSLGGDSADKGPVKLGGPDGGTAPGGDGDRPTESEFGSYLARLRSDSVQGWARESAGRAKQGWKGSGKAGEGWGPGTGTGPGTGAGTGPGPGGKGTGKGGGGYLDPRVRMVVTSYPPTDIEKGYTQVPYPDLKVKQHQATAGWWNVYIQIATDKDGRIVRRKVVRPETDGPLERMFVAQVQKEIDRWTFERAEAEILVDVRFHVE